MASWFSTLIASQTVVFLVASVCLNVKLDIPICSLSAPDGIDVPLASVDELRQHSFTWCNTTRDSRKKIKRQFDWPRCSRKFHGFILFDTSADTCPHAAMSEADREQWNEVFHHKLPELMRKKHFRNQFFNIFARVHGSRAARAGDGKRKQIKFSKLTKIARRRLDNAASDQKKRAAQEELEIILMAQELMAKQYKLLVQVSCYNTFGLFLRCDVS